MDENKTPTVTIILATVNIFVFLLEWLFGEDYFAYSYAMYEGAFSDGEWFRALTSGFLHFGLAHIVSNMICLIALGRILERQIGSGRFAVLYFGSLLGGSLLIDYAGGAALHGGASGAIWGLMTASVIRNIKNRQRVLDSLKGIIFNLIYSFSAGVSWQAHIGGGITGALITLLLFMNI